MKAGLPPISRLWFFIRIPITCSLSRIDQDPHNLCGSWLSIRITITCVFFKGAFRRTEASPGNILVVGWFIFLSSPPFPLPYLSLSPFLDLNVCRHPPVVQLGAHFVQRFRGGLVSEAHRPLYDSAEGSRIF